MNILYKMNKKICTCCKIEKPLSEFYRNSMYKDGRDFQCGECTSAKRKSRIEMKKFYESNPHLIPEPPTHRFCRWCREHKLLSEFVKVSSKRCKSGITTKCKKCANIDTLRSKHRKETPEAINSRIKSAKWRRDNPELYRFKSRVSSYKRVGIKITEQEYYNLLKVHNGTCDICGGVNEHKRNTQLSLDHDHKTGKARGLLCEKCNRGIGLLRDDTDILYKAINYIKRGQTCIIYTPNINSDSYINTEWL